MEITSANNPRYKSWLKALEGRGIKKQGQAVLAGKKFLQEVLTGHKDRVLALLAREGMPCPAPENVPMYTMPGELFENLELEKSIVFIVLSCELRLQMIEFLLKFLFIIT